MYGARSGTAGAALYSKPAAALRRLARRADRTGRQPAIAALTAAGIPYEVHQTLAKNQMVLLKENQQPACMLSWLQTPERERIGKFTDVVYQDKRPVRADLGRQSGHAQ
jgi:hypothetical protein